MEAAYTRAVNRIKEKTGFVFTNPDLSRSNRATFTSQVSHFDTHHMAKLASTGYTIVDPKFIIQGDLSVIIEHQANILKVHVTCEYLDAVDLLNEIVNNNRLNHEW